MQKLSKLIFVFKNFSDRMVGVHVLAKAWHRSSSSTKLLATSACILLFAFCTSSCKPSPQFQDHYNIPNAQWSSSYQPQFKFRIDDTAAAYQLFLLIRHTDAYPFSNIWINMDSKGPHDSAFKKLRVEVPLATPGGQWLGRGMGELWEQRIAINSLQMPLFFPHKGLYTVRLTQDMRRDPLPEVLTMGLRLEKLPPFRKEQE